MKKMSMERAAEIIQDVKDGQKRIDLFGFFVDYFDIKTEYIEAFAIMCGYPIARNVKPK